MPARWRPHACGAKKRGRCCSGSWAPGELAWDCSRRVGAVAGQKSRDTEAQRGRCQGAGNVKSPPSADGGNPHRNMGRRAAPVTPRAHHMGSLPKGGTRVLLSAGRPHIDPKRRVERLVCAGGDSGAMLPPFPADARGGGDEKEGPKARAAGPARRGRGARGTKPKIARPKHAPPPASRSDGPHARGSV
jgi:hypothetical protein